MRIFFLSGPNELLCEVFTDVIKHPSYVNNYLDILLIFKGCYIHCTIIQIGLQQSKIYYFFRSTKYVDLHVLLQLIFKIWEVF